MGCYADQMDEIPFLMRTTLGREPTHRPAAPSNTASIIARTHKHPGWHHLMQFKAAFQTHSVHGAHLCIVSNVLGPPVSDLPKLLGLRVLPIASVKAIARQMLLALSYIHGSCGVIHCGKPRYTSVLTKPSSRISRHQTTERAPAASWAP